MVGEDVKYCKNRTTETSEDHEEHKLGLTLPQYHHGKVRWWSPQRWLNSPSSHIFCVIFSAVV